MLLLLVFALIAGAGTAVTPCVLPVLPALLSASAVGGRRRPFGIILGLAVTFTISIVVLATISNHIGLGAGTTRIIAWVILILFGVVMLIPPLVERIQAPLSRLAQYGPKTRGDGFVTGIGVGAALGFVCAPCAGPILTAVIAAGVSGHTTGKIVAIAIAYTIGLCALLALYSVGGRKVIDVIRTRTHGGHLVEQVLAVILIITGVAIATNLDTKFEKVLGDATSGANHSSFLAFIVDPTHGLEKSHAVQSRLNKIRPEGKFQKAQDQADAQAKANQAKAGATDSATNGTTSTSTGTAPGVALAGVKTPTLNVLGQAPNFVGTQDWFNTPGDKPLTMAGLRGKVVLVDFWTYTCINCIRTLPFIEGLYKTYAKSGLVIVGIEAPEFEFEHEASNVRSAIKTDGITYPVVQDNNLSTWNAYGNDSWPADYLIDAQGNVRHVQVGEGDYASEEAAVRQLLYDAGHHTLPAPTTAKAAVASSGLQTFETYLNPQRFDDDDQQWPAAIQLGTHNYTQSEQLLNNDWELEGQWTADQESITPAAASAKIEGGFQAQHVYLVMTSNDNTPRKVHLLLDGKPLPKADYGSDVSADGTVTVTGQRLYSLLNLPQDQADTITVEVPKGVSAYDFTFG